MLQVAALEPLLTGCGLDDVPPVGLEAPRAEKLSVVHIYISAACIGAECISEQTNQLKTALCLRSLICKMTATTSYACWEDYTDSVYM